MGWLGLFSDDASGRTLHVPSGCLEAYQAAPRWSNCFGTIVEMQVETGDINGDGIVNISDVTDLISLLLNDGELPDYCDVDGDGKVNITDVTALIDLLLNGN